MCLKTQTRDDVDTGILNNYKERPHKKVVYKCFEKRRVKEVKSRVYGEGVSSMGTLVILLLKEWREMGRTARNKNSVMKSNGNII